MATETCIAELVSISKGEGEERDLTNVQLDASADENYPGELKKVEGAVSAPPEIFEYSEKTESNIGIETVSTVNKGHAGTSEGDNFLESSSVSKVAHEETGRVSEDYQAGEIPIQAEKEIFREETELQKYKKFEVAEEMGKVENEGMEEIKEGEEKLAEELRETSQTNPTLVQRALGEAGCGGDEDKESEKSSILMLKENDPEAEEKEHESDKGKKIPSDSTRDVTMATVAASTAETTLQEAGVTFEEKSQDTIVLHEKVKDVILDEGDTQDQNKLDTPCVGHTKDTGLLKVDKPETLKEVSESGTDIKEIPDEKNLPQVDLNEKIESEEAEILKKSSNELLVSSPSVEEAVQVEGDKPVDISKFEPQEQVHETNGVLLEEKKNFEEAPEAYKSTESLILEPTSIEGEKASNTYAEAIDYGLDTEKESKEKNAGQNIEEEIQRKEEACDPEIHKNRTRSNEAEKGKIDEDVSSKVSDTAGTGNETIQKSFQLDYLDEAPSALTSEGKGDKAKDDAEKDNIIPEEVHDEIKNTGTMEGTRELIAGEDDATEGLPESIREEKVKSFPDNEKALLADEKSKGQDNNEQTVADNVKGTPESIKEENFRDNENEDEKCREEIFESSVMARAGECVESEKILDTSMVKPKESLLVEGENQVSIDESTEEKRDEHRYSVMDEDNDDNTGLVEVQYDVKDEMPIVKENTGWTSQKDETGEKLEQSLTVMSKVTETINSSENTEKFSSSEDRAIQDIEETFEKEEEKVTKNSEERGAASEEDLKPVAVASEMNKSTERIDLELTSEEGEMEVEKIERGNELGSEERFKGNDAREEIEEEIKKEETYDADLHKVETTGDDTEKSKIEEDALIKDASTVWIGEEIVELSCQEDEDGRNDREKVALELNGGDHNVRIDNETETSADQIISEEIAIGQGTEKHTINKEQITIDISPQSSGEERHKSSQEDETKEEEPKVEMCERMGTTTVGEGIEGRTLEGDTIQAEYTVPTEVKETEDIPKYNEMMEKMPEPEVCETTASCQDRSTEFTEKDTGSPQEDENKTSVDPCEKLEGAPESVAKDQSNETFLEMNQTQDKENSNNVQDQKCESVVEEQNIEQGLQEDEKNKYEEIASRSDASDHEIQNENETTSERTMDISHSSEVSEEISKPIIQEAETCYNKLDTASKKVETEATCSWEAQPDENPLKGTESTSEEKTVTTAETSLHGGEDDNMKLDESTEFMSQLPAIHGENADKESSTTEKSHVDEVQETKGDSEIVSEAKEQCVEDIDGTQKSLTVEYSEGITKEEIKGPSETLSGCNYQVVEAVIEDEINVVKIATTGESEEQHPETSKASLPKEQVDGIIATIRNLEDGKAEEGATIQNENLEDSFATRTSEEICLHKEEPRELESGLGVKLDENIHNINPDEPPKEECITLDEVSHLEPQENVSAIKCSDSPTERDEVMELSEEVIEEAEKSAEESEDIKEHTTEKDRDVNECFAVSPGDDLVNKVQHSETISDENPRATDSGMQIEQVNLEVMEDFSKDHEGSSITKAVEEEMLQKQPSERKVDVSSFESEISEGMSKEVMEDADICSNNIDTASEKVETEDTRLQEAQLDHKHIKTIETGSEDKTLQTNTTPETSPQSEEVDSVKLEETPDGVSQCPVIACENTDKECEIVEKPHIDDVEEIKGTSEPESESIEQHVEGIDEIRKSLIVEESDEGIIKEEIKRSSGTGSGCSHQGVKVVIEDNVDVVNTAAEEQNQETSKALLSEEQDHEITTATGDLEDGKAEEGETPQNEDLEDSLATGTTKGICSQKEKPRELEIFGLGIELNENIQNVNPDESPKDECVTLDVVSQLEPQENISTIKCSDPPKESDKVTELPAEVPEGDEKAAEESENIQELIMEKERDIKECPAVSNEDELVKAQYSETVSDNPRATDSEVQTEKMNHEVVEDFSNDSEGSPTTKAMEEESGKKVDVYCCVSDISESINKEAIEDADACSNNSDNASQKLETKETRSQEAQMNDKQIKIIETSSKDEMQETDITIETSPQGEEVDNIKLEETPDEVSQFPPIITCENTDEREAVEKPQADEVEEVKGISEIVSESREQFSEENDGIQKSVTVEESESIIKEEIRGLSKIVSGCNYDDVEVVVEDELDVSQTATTRKSEEQHQETSRALLSAEQDCGIIATIECSDDGKTEEVGTPQNENLEDSKTTEETCLHKEEPKDLEISGVGIELSENIQNFNPNEPPEEVCVTLDEVSQLEPQETVPAIKCSDSPTKSDKVMELSKEVLEGPEKAAEESEDIKKLIIEKERNAKECPTISIGDESANKVLHSEIVSDENARSTDFEVQAEKGKLQVVEDFSKDLEGYPVTKAMEEEMLRKQGSEKNTDISGSVSEVPEEINKEVVDDCSYNIDTASEKVETEDTSLREAQLDEQHIQITETRSETSQLQTNITTETIDSLTEEALEETEKAAESENIKKLIIEKEAESEEQAIEDESANKVQHSDTVPSENLGATDSNIQTEKANLYVLENFSQELEGTPIEKALPQIQVSEKTVDISCFVSEISAETAKEVLEDTDACHDKLDTAYEKVVTEETRLQEAQLNDEHIKIIETSSEYKKLQTSPQGEEVDGVELEETPTLVSQFPAIACENADKESEAVEKPAKDDVEETKGPSDIESDSKEQQVEVFDETQKNPAVEESKDLLTEEIKGPSETVSQSKYQGVETITEEKIIAVETAIAGKSEKQHQETSDSLLYEEQDHEISITIGYSEDGNTKEDVTQQNENPEDSFATEKADYMHLQKEEHRKLEISGLGLELNENIQNNNLTEPPKEGCDNIDEASPLDAQEHVSLVKCTNSPLESDIAMELTKEVPEEAEKAVERENIKELIIEKEREIKELPAVSIDESVNKVQVLEPVSSENLGGPDPNMQTENLILEVEDLSKEPEGSPITKSLEEVSDKQNDQKAMYVPSSVYEMKEHIKEVIVEKANISCGELDTESEKGETRESSSQEAQLDDKPLEIIETSSVDKTLQTNTTTETSQQTEEVDCMKLEETLELASQFPANGCESTNKESETVENPNADELEETAGASETVPQSKEQCAEEIDENQKSLALETSEEDITKEQMKQAFEKESEIKYQGVEAVIEEEIIAGQAIKADVPEEQLKEVSTAILSEEQEHRSYTTIGKSEDENIKEGVTGQNENAEDSFGTETSEEICLQKEEPRELDVSGSKEDGNIVDGVSQYEQQENASELKYTDSPLGNEKVMEQTRSIGSTDQEATKDGKNMDSGVINNNPDVLPHLPGEEISQEEGEKCEDASNFECEHYENASEPVSNPESAAIDEAVVELEVGAHIHGSDTSNTKNSENLREKVPQGDEEAVESESIKELIIETERDINDLPAVAIEDGTVHKDQHAEAVSNENLTAIACESADKESKTVERPHADVVEEPSGTSDTVSESREQCVEKFVEIQESLTLENSDENIIKEEIKGPGDGVSECTNQSFEAATENEVTADQTIEAEKPEEQLQERSTALVSEEQEHGISTITTKLEDENTVENETPQYQTPQDSFGTKMTEERCLHKEESRDLKVYELELNNDVQKKISSEEPKEGGDALYRITSLEPQEDALEIKCTDPLAESDMELTRSVASTSQEASKDDEDLDPGISIKNVNDVLPPCSSGEEILQEVDENSKEASNLEGEEGKEIEKASESTFQVQSAEVDEAALELEAGSHSHGSEPSSIEKNNPNEKNIELAGLGEKLGGRPELMAEDQCTEILLETNQTQVNGTRSRIPNPLKNTQSRHSAWEQNTQSIEEQLTGQEEREKETIEETERKLEFRDYINVVQNENVTTKDVILVEEVPEEAEIDEEKENIQEHMIEEKRDTEEHDAVSIEDNTVDKVHNSESVSCESYRATESNQETKEVNLEDEEDPCEKQADVSSSVFELSDKGFKGEILDAAGKDNKLNTACEKEEAEKTILQEPQLVDEPLKSTETILEEKIPSIINTTKTSPGDEEAEVVKQDKTSDLVTQLQTTTYEHTDNERIIVEKPQADEVEETKRASDAVSESKDPCVEEINETQRSLNMEKMEEEIIEEISGRSRTVLTCNPCVGAILQDEIIRESPETGNSEEQLQEMSTPLLPEEEEHAEKKSQTENLEDSLGTESVEEISLQKEGFRELEVSALAPKLSDVIPQESPNEVLKDEGQPQENAPNIEYMGSTTGSQEVVKLTRSINSFSQNTLKEEEILDSESYNNKADDLSISHSSGEILQKMQEQREKIPILESKKIEQASESVSEVHYTEVIIKLEETEAQEEHLKTSVAEMKTEEILHKKIEANEIIKNEISNEEIAEEKQVAKDYQPESLDKETIRKRQQGDELKNEAEHEELSEGSKKDEASENIEKQIIDEARTVKHPPLVSFRNESVKDDLPEEAKEERNDKETHIKLDLANQSDQTALSEQANCSEIQLVKTDLNITDAHDDKPNLDVQPATRAAAEEASHQKEGDRIREVSESVPQEPVHETIRCNEEIVTAITDHSENIMEDNVHTHIPCELACNEPYVSEGLNLKDLEVNTNENGTSPFSETSWEEIPDKESVISEAERQHDLTSGEQTIAASMSTEEKGAKDEVVQVKDDGEHTKAEEPIEFSARGTERKLEEAEIHSTACHKDGEIQDQIENLSASSQVQDSRMEISEKEVNMDLAEANESTQDIKKLEKGSDETSQKHIPREAEPNESTEVTISSSKEEVQPVPQGLQPEVGSLESVNVSWLESGAGAKDMGGEKAMGDISEQPAVDPTPSGPAVSFSDLLQKSIKETLQAPGCLTDVKEKMVNKEYALAKEEEGSDVQEAETHEDEDQEEEGDEHRKDDSGSDAPIIVEASRDMNPKDGHKKSHNILSGVGSKVKHSIAKVKKAITGKSSHQKHSSPKGTATKVKEQK